MNHSLKYIIEDGIEYTVYEFENGDKFWRLNNRFHRENGPAIEYANGIRIWYKHNKLHREDGPTVIYPDERQQEYWLDGDPYDLISSDEEWINLITIKGIIE
jgi:hypothetical protein